MADASMVLPVAHQRQIFSKVRRQTGSWYPIHPDDWAVRNIRVYPMLDCLVLCYPPCSGRALCSYFAEALMVELRLLSNGEPFFDDHQLLDFLLLDILFQLRTEFGYVLLVESVLGEISTALYYVLVPTKATQDPIELRVEVFPPNPEDSISITPT